MHSSGRLKQQRKALNVAYKSQITDWTLPGASGELIYGNSHLPGGDPSGVVVIAHGFKGYKDYGMLPRIAETCAAAGFIAHRFNFSHSGMTNDIEKFAWPDLFEKDTWNLQVEDLHAVFRAIEAGTLAGADVPLILFGHSRGGVAALLTAGRSPQSIRMLAGVATAAAPATCLSLSEAEQSQLLHDGFLPSPSSRTGQMLRIGTPFLQEQLENPASHDLLKIAAKVTCPVLVVHGSEDPTVPVESATHIVQAIAEPLPRLLKIEGADHVFNTPNPLPDLQPSSPQLRQLIDALIIFACDVCQPGDG